MKNIVSFKADLFTSHDFVIFLNPILYLNVNLKFITMITIKSWSEPISASQLDAEEQAEMYKKSIMDTKKELSDLNACHKNISSRLVGAKCSCSEAEFLPDENQWEPGYTCAVHQELEYVEHSILCAKEYLANLERSLAIAEYQPL